MSTDVREILDDDEDDDLDDELVDADDRDEDEESDEDEETELKVIVHAQDEEQLESITWALDEEDSFKVDACSELSELSELLMPSIRDPDADDPADLIIADHTSIEILQSYRKADRTTPILLITDEDEDEFLDVADGLDAQILSTSFDGPELVEAISNAAR